MKVCNSRVSTTALVGSLPLGGSCYSINCKIQDGLWFLCEAIREGIAPLPSAILTPNIVEFSRLCESALGIPDVLEVKVGS